MTYIWRARLDGEPLRNLTAGGEGTIGYKHTKESKLKIQKALKGKMPSELCMQNMLKINTGRKFSTKDKEKLRRASFKAKPILCVNNGKYYSSARFAAKELSLKDHKGILRSIKLKKPYCGLFFEYKILNSI